MKRRVFTAREMGQLLYDRHGMPRRVTTSYLDVHFTDEFVDASLDPPRSIEYHLDLISQKHDFDHGVGAASGTAAGDGESIAVEAQRSDAATARQAKRARRDAPPGGPGPRAAEDPPAMSPLEMAKLFVAGQSLFNIEDAAVVSGAGMGAGSSGMGGVGTPHLMPDDVELLLELDGT